MKLMVLFFASFCTLVQATIPHENTIILQSRRAGMFSIFQDVLSLLQLYEKGRFEGAKVDFDTTGLFYDQNEGPDWWSYYFEPISLGRIGDAKIYNNLESWRIEFCNSKEFNNYLINKYIRLKPSLINKIEQFQSVNFLDHYIIGMHYRGGDKVIPGSEAARVSYEDAAQSIRNCVNELGNRPYKIFIASDEISFIRSIRAQFPKKVIYYKQAHTAKTNKERGEAAIIDSILLSKTNFLIRTNSNLSLCSLFFTPTLNSIELSKGFWHPVKMMKNQSKNVLAESPELRERFCTALESYLLNNGETILILGNPDLVETFEILLYETPQKIIQSSQIISLEKSVLNMDLVYVDESQDKHHFEVLCDKMLQKKGSLILLSDQTLDYAPYLLSRGFDYLNENPFIFINNR